MRRVFVDTSAFYAHVDHKDKFHARATTLLRQAEREGWELSTTSTNVYETYTLILRELGQASVAIGFLDRIKAGLCEVVLVKEHHHDAAEAIVRKHRSKRLSLFDALSFTVMEELGLEEAIAFDRDFRSYGRFTLL